MSGLYFILAGCFILGMLVSLFIALWIFKPQDKSDGGSV